MISPIFCTNLRPLLRVSRPQRRTSRPHSLSQLPSRPPPIAARQLRTSANQRAAEVRCEAGSRHWPRHARPRSSYPRFRGRDLCRGCDWPRHPRICSWSLASDTRTQRPLSLSFIAANIGIITASKVGTPLCTELLLVARLLRCERGP